MRPAPQDRLEAQLNQAHEQVAELTAFRDSLDARKLQVRCHYLACGAASECATVWGGHALTTASFGAGAGVEAGGRQSTHSGAADAASSQRGGDRSCPQSVGVRPRLLAPSHTVAPGSLTPDLLRAMRVPHACLSVSVFVSVCPCACGHSEMEAQAAASLEEAQQARAAAVAARDEAEATARAAAEEQDRLSEALSLRQEAADERAATLERFHSELQVRLHAVLHGQSRQHRVVQCTRRTR